MDYAMAGIILAIVTFLCCVGFYWLGYRYGRRKGYWKGRDDMVKTVNATIQSAPPGDFPSLSYPSSYEQWVDAMTMDADSYYRKYPFDTFSATVKERMER